MRPESRQIGFIKLQAVRHTGWVLVARSALYIWLVSMVAVVAGAYRLRRYSIFSCSASGYSADAYLSYCNATNYGDYDHGALWFGLEPSARSAAANAHVLFLGNSRTQFAFFTQATVDWFSSQAESYYLLGFSHNENCTFEAPFLRTLRSRASTYVINIDSFFDASESGPGKTVMGDDSARAHYEEKRQWQSLHRMICIKLPIVCGNEGAFFRSRSEGAWVVTGGPFASAPVTYNDSIDRTIVKSYAALGSGFLPTLSANPACTILTIVPTVNTRVGTAQAVAAALGHQLIAPRLPSLVTFDGVHLDRESAQRWSYAFFEQAGPQIQECLSEEREEQITASDVGPANR